MEDLSKEKPSEVRTGSSMREWEMGQMKSGGIIFSSGSMRVVVNIG